MPRIDRSDALVIAGLALVLAGIAMLSIAASAIVGGAALIGLGLLSTSKGGQRR